MFAMLEPKTLPRLIAAWPSRAASTDTTSSGADVPQATTVRPMARELIPRRRASPALPPTSQSAPLASNTKPATR